MKADINRTEQNFDGTVRMAWITQEELDGLRAKLAMYEQENKSLREELYGPHGSTEKPISHRKP